jgi:Uncharacterized protein conserved in bacteria
MSIKERWTDFKSLVASFVVWAESELKGKTGTEKQTAVVEMIHDKFPWPFPLRLAQKPLLKIAVGWVSGKIVDALNIVTDHDFADIVADPKEIVEASKISKPALSAVQEIEAETREKTIEERFKALCAIYGLDTDEIMESEVRFVSDPVVGTEEPKIAGTPKSYFQRSEFTCKCGCGTNKAQQSLIDMLNVIRGEFGRPVTVTSGTRCVSNNAKVGGATNSNHLTRHGADIRCTDGSITPKRMYGVVMGLYNEGRIPQLAGISCNYPTILHIDVYPKKADGTLRTW